MSELYPEQSDNEPEEETTKIIVNPYNFNNKHVNEKFISSIFKRFDMPYQPHNMDLYQNAFIHKSYCKEKLLALDPNTELVSKPEGALPLMDVDNERLEFLGDSVLSPITAKYLYERYSDQNEGFMTKMRSRLVMCDTLGYFAKELGFAEYLIVSRHIEDMCNGREATHLLEDAFEAFMGAVFLDFNNLPSDHKLHREYATVFNNFYSGIGYQVCEELFTNIFEELVDFSELILKDINYKDQIARYFHKTFNKPIKYKEIEVSDDPNEKLYTMAALDVDENILTVGKGNTKKRAEQQAAKNALIHFNLLEE